MRQFSKGKKGAPDKLASFLIQFHSNCLDRIKMTNSASYHRAKRANNEKKAQKKRRKESLKNEEEISIFFQIE